MKISLFHILILLVFLSSGCTGLLKPGKQADVNKQDSSAIKKHKAAGDISGKKIQPPPSATRKKEIKKERDASKKKKIMEYLALAEKSFSEKNYDKTIAITKKIQALDPKNKRALFLKNDACYMSGKALYEEHKYLDSLKIFSNIKQDYKDVREITAIIKTKINNQAETHYKKGVKYFINEELKKAIAEWEKTLLLNPDHPKALKDIEDAKHLLEELEKIQ